MPLFNDMRYVLASASPRRKQLLAGLVKDFEIIPSQADEKVEGTPSPKSLVAQLAAMKAEEVAKRPENEGKVIIGSDTVVAFGKTVLGKPKDEEDAKRMLKLLSGRTHEVFTGVCIITPCGKEFTDVACTRVRFYPLQDDWIDVYVQGGSPMDKAGAYGIQDGGLVQEIDGSYSNVVGLPQELCGEMIKKITETEKE